MNGVRIFDLITQEQVFEKDDDRLSFIAENLISYPDGNADKTVCVNLDNGKTYTYEGRVSFINLDSYRNKKAVFPLRLVKYGDITTGGATVYDVGYDCGRMEEHLYAWLRRRNWNVRNHRHIL